MELCSNNVFLLYISDFTSAIEKNNPKHLSSFKFETYKINEAAKIAETQMSVVAVSNIDINKVDVTHKNIRSGKASPNVHMCRILALLICFLFLFIAKALLRY